MRINYIEFLDPFRYGGGGEMNSRALIEYGRKLGHDIRVGARRTGKLSRFYNPFMRLHAEPDLWILCDVFNCPDTNIEFQPGFIDSIIRSKCYIHIDNAYVDICKKGGLPCNGIRTSAMCSTCVDPGRFDIYKNSVACVFLSPLHEQIIRGMLPTNYIKKSFLLRPCIDTQIFKNYGKVRDIEYLYVGTISAYKGYSNLKNRFGGQTGFLFIGTNTTGEKLFGEHIPYVKNEELPLYYNRSKHFVHLPQWKEPAARTVVEAALCGCEIITNENVGVVTFPFSLSDPAQFEIAEQEFWSNLSALL